MRHSTTPIRFGPGLSALLAGAILVGCQNTQYDPPIVRDLDAPPIDASPAPEPFGSPDKVMVVDAMVGQVNGRPIFAHDVLDEISEAQLIRLGQDRTRQEFEAEVRKLIKDTLFRRIQDELILAEARNKLSENQRLGLRAMMSRQREKLVAIYGQGATAQAEVAIRAQKGHSLARELELFEEKVLVINHIREKVHNKIHVSRREIARFYIEHPNDPRWAASTTKVRGILVFDEKKAAEAEKALADGTAFLDVAKAHSSILAEEGGVVFEHGGKLESFDVIGWGDAVNVAVRKLKAGEHTAKIEVDQGWAWARLENLGGTPKALDDVYLLIEKELYARKTKTRQDEYRREVLKSNNFSSIPLMEQGLVEVALSRYARPPAPSVSDPAPAP